MYCLNLETVLANLNSKLRIYGEMLMEGKFLLQANRGKLEHQRCAISDHQGALLDFLRHYPSINVAKYQEQLTDLEHHWGSH